MGKATPNQVNYLLKKNLISLEQSDNISFEQASQLISNSKQPSGSSQSPYNKQNTPKSTQNTSTMYVAYVKDLIVAQIANGKALDQELIDKAIAAVKTIKQVFDN